MMSNDISNGNGSSVDKDHLDLQHQTNVHQTDLNSSKTLIRRCARGRGVQIYMARHAYRGDTLSSLLSLSNKHCTTNLNVYKGCLSPSSLSSIGTSIQLSDLTGISKEEAQQGKQVVVDKACSLPNPIASIEYQEKEIFIDPITTYKTESQQTEQCVNEKDADLLLCTQANVEYINDNILLNIQNKNQLAPIERTSHYLSRPQIESEIFNMINNILLSDPNQKCSSLYVADARCHFDTLFDKLNCPNQTIWKYLEHNHRIYEKGIDMLYIIQAYFAPCHFLEENWKQKFSRYMGHPIVYGVVGMHPLYAHHLDLTMELNIRRCISHPKVKGVGEIGLDYSSTLRPSDDSQIYAFVQQLSIAREKNLPVVVHSRNSFIQTMEILCQELPNDHKLCWRQFDYGNEEMDIVKLKFSCVFFGCSPSIFVNENMKKMIQRADINSLLIESAAPHLTIDEARSSFEIYLNMKHNFISLVPSCLGNAPDFCHKSLSMYW
ncbi:unnamed protein product [Rotaria sordida]|uniref:Uncharacterized protein n=1 Tax=Rotaria sordida TaxID=392033 RepID=A0A815DWR6_9BILA|nr:unnamed protein product [Rotaria sordida]CAF1572882.1 unnamed protein product [Rotaria sordida]